jgi:hypothetical protein
MQKKKVIKGTAHIAVIGDEVWIIIDCSFILFYITIELIFFFDVLSKTTID